MKTFTALAGSGLLLFGTAAIAQDIGPAETVPGDNWDAPAETLPAPAETWDAPADTAELPETSAPLSGDDHTGHTFSDAEIASFAAAALEIQDLPGGATQEQAATIVAQSGIDAETFNAIGQAMQTDPDLAERVQIAASGLQGEGNL